MTRPRNPAEPAPAAELAAVHRTGGGQLVVVPLRVTNRAGAPRTMVVTPLGLDPDWLPAPVRIGPLPPGGTATAELELRPPSGTKPASYPFAVAVQPIEPATGRPTSATTLAEAALLVDGASRVSMSVQPADSVAVFGRRIEVELRNAGGGTAEVELRTEAADGLALRLSRHRIVLPPGGIARVRGRVAVSRPQLVGGRNRHPFLVAARGLGAPTSVTGSVTARPLFSPLSTRLVALVAVLSIWLAAALIGIPKLAGAMRPGQPKTATATAAGNDLAKPSAQTTSAKATGKPAAKPGGSSAAAVTGAQAAAAAAAAKAAAAAAGVRLNGVVTATAPAGVTVSLQPTSLVDEKAQNAEPVGESAHAMANRLSAVGKISAQQLGSPVATAVSGRRSTVTQASGAWSFAGISSPGYYLLTFSKPGYQTRKYILNAADADASQPLPVTMSAGTGRLTGHITGPSGPVGGATITITDGQNTLTTSSDSTGKVGDWSVTGLSTPGTYLVSASKDGLGLESGDVTLAAGGSATVNLTLRAGVGALVGTVAGQDGPLGGASVTVTDGTITRTATTVTGGPVGDYTVPALPVPGDYTVTVAAEGYLPQTKRVQFGPGQSKSTAAFGLDPSTVTVQGTVAGPDHVGLPGAGLVLTGQAGQYKTMSLSEPLGQFTFSGVNPGTYVLSAEMYGRITGYATVVAAFGSLKPVSLVLASTPGGALPATAHVHGRVTDARSGGQLTCDQADGYDPTQPGSLGNKALCKVNVGVDLSAAAVAAACATPAVAHPNVVCGVDPSQEYTVPAEEPGAGLLPGLHHVVVAAPGYESGTLDVSVPVGVTTEAAPVAVYPAASVVGTVEAAVGNLNTGPDPAFPDDPDEPVPAGQDYAHQTDYRTCVIAVPTGTGPAAPPGCTVVPAASSGGAGSSGGAASCTTDATGGKCTLTSTVDGSYSVRGLDHGAYVVYVVPKNPEYHALPGAQLILDRGSTDRYDANLHRLGRLDLSVLAPDGTGGLITAAGATVTVTPAPTVAQHTLMAGLRGRLQIIGLAPGAHQISATEAPSQGSGTGSASVLTGEDQDTTSQLALTQSITQVVGQVTSSYTGTPQVVGGAQVTISGVVAYAGTVPIRGQVTVTTDGNGCFAVTSDGNAPTMPASNPSGVCYQHLADLPRSPLPLVIAQADLSVTKANYQQFTQIGAAISTESLLPVNLTPSGQQISGSVALNPSGDNPAGVLVTVDRKAPGSGVIDVSVGSDGSLTWQDSEYQQANEVGPGSYQLTASMPGYASSTVQVTCDLGTGCTVPTMTLAKYGQLSMSTVDGGGSPVPNAIFVLSATGLASVTQTAPPGANTVTFAGLDPSLAYTVRIQAAGYAFGSSYADSCGGSGPISIQPGQLTACTATLAARASITGVTSGVYGSVQQPLGNALVTATFCGASASSLADCPALGSGSAFTAVSGTDGSYRITGTSSRDGLLPGGWALDLSEAGYTEDSRVFVTVTDAAYSQPLSLTVKPVTLKLGVQGPDSSLITDATVSMTAASGGDPITPTAPGTDKLYTFSNLIPTVYSVQISGTGIVALNVQVTVLVGVASQTDYVRTDVRSNSIAGLVSGQQGTDLAASALNGVTVTVVDAGTKKTVTSTTTGSTSTDGYYSFNTVPDGNYLVQFSKTGYIENDTPVAVSGGQSATVSPTLARVTNNVVVNLSSVNGYSLTGAKAYLTAVDPNPPQTEQTLSLAGTQWSTTFNAVPSGSWTVWVQLPDNHNGVVLSTGKTPVAVDSGSPYPVTVSTSSGQASTVGLSITEAELDLSVTATPLALDGNPAPDQVKLTVNQGTTGVYSQPTFTVGSATVPIWVTPSVTYTVSADPGTGFGAGWTATTTPVTPASSKTAKAATVPLVEKGGTIAATVQLADGTAVGQALVSVTPLDTNVGPVTSVKTDSTGKVTFTDLPAGKYTVEATYGSSPTAKTGQASVTVSVGKTTSQTITVS